ncbi:MAG: asparagine synthase (glutamine-hydrolyzing) [Phycisphaerales bacterium JB038]
MCGLACILRTNDESIPEDWLTRAQAALRHRGPDDAGVHREAWPSPTGDLQIALVHQRLSILDHAGGKQPMSTVDGGVTVVFNGCIYNHRELRRELEGEGAQFRSDHSDTEVLLHGWRAWGELLPTRLEGMFAFILVDSRQRQLFAARDRAGEKPLHLLARPGLLCLASSRAVFRSLERGANLSQADPAVLASYLRWGYIDDGPWLDGSESVGPGEQLRVDLANGEARTTRQRYWRMPPDRCENLSPAEAEDRVGELLRDSVAQRLEADVPLGCFLSGGVDSSLIAALAREQKPDLKTFCVRMNEARYDESQHAQRVAAHLGLEHTTLDVDPDPARDLPELIAQLGEPFADSSLLPTHWVSLAAREHVTVALAGDAGDELFLGYERHIAGQVLDRLGWLLRLLPTGLLPTMHPTSRWTKLGRLARAAREPGWQGKYESIICLFDGAQLASLGLPAAETKIDAPPRTGQERFVAADFERNLPWDLLRKVDTASMACALEVRAPFLDRALVEFALQLPLETLTPKLERKALLKRAAGKHVPANLLDRPKMGFAIPLGEWFRNDFGGMRMLLRETLESADPFRGLPIEQAGVRALLQEHEAGRANHEHRLFALLTLALWATQTGPMEPSCSAGG